MNTNNNPYSEVTPQIFDLAKECAHNNHIDKELYAKHKTPHKHNI